MLSDKELSNLVKWKPGQSGNPRGRPSAGLVIKEYINSLSDKDLTREQIFAISKDPKEPWSKRMAAIRMVRAIEDPDIADYEEYLGGQINLQELRARGVDTRPIKKIDETVRRIPQGKDNEPIVEIERKLELHDRSGDDFDRILDQTAGKPTQQVQIDEKREIQITVNVRPMGSVVEEIVGEVLNPPEERGLAEVDPSILEVPNNDPIPIRWPRDDS